MQCSICSRRNGLTVRLEVISKGGKKKLFVFCSWFHLNMWMHADGIKNVLTSTGFKISDNKEKIALTHLFNR